MNCWTKTLHGVVLQGFDSHKNLDSRELPNRGSKTYAMMLSPYGLKTAREVMGDRQLAERSSPGLKAKSHSGEYPLPARLLRLLSHRLKKG